MKPILKGNWRSSKDAMDASMAETLEWLAAMLSVDVTEIEDQGEYLLVRGSKVDNHGRWVISEKGEDAFKRYWDQLAVRKQRRLFPTTEDKIAARKRDLYFYRWVDNKTGRLVMATLIDLRLFRKHMATMRKCYCVNKPTQYGAFNSSFDAYFMEEAADRGCVMQVRYAPDAPVSKWKRKQLENRIEKNRAPAFRGRKKRP